MTAEQATEFVRLMLLESLIGGLLGAIAWDAIKSGSAAFISGVSELLARRQRIAAARKRAEDSFFESQ